MADDATAGKATDYQALEKKSLDAFEHWHRFHEDLIKLGEFASWLGEDDHQIDLVSFFVLDGENTDNYRQAIGHQIDFINGLREMLEATAEMIGEYQSRRAADE